MSTRPYLRTRAVLVAAGVALALAGGCKKEEEPVATQTGNPAPEMKTGKLPSPGELLFGQKGCVRCHSVGGPPAAGFAGPKGKRMGPDLSKVGADPAHTPEWLAAYIRDPHGQNEGSKMPKHDESKISEQEMDTLVKYLSSFK
jgi:cbb3-type cytochrome oxidase cytochrome c subunit